MRHGKKTCQIQEVIHLLYPVLARIGFRRNTSYRWSHLLLNFASLFFGFLYISLWQAVAPESSATDPYTRTTMVEIIALAQVFAVVTVFLPAGLGIHVVVRSGNIAIEMARPVPFFPMIIAREAGTILYQALYRSLPMLLLFQLTIGMPAPASLGHLALTLLSLVLGAYTALTLFYSVGLSSLWTVEIRWAHSLYYTLATLLSGGWIPADILPGWLGQVAPYLPFASQLFYPIRLYLGMSPPGVLLIQLTWAALLTLWCLWLTRKAFHRVVIQGG